MSQIVERYLACWNETDEQKRAGLVAALFEPQARYVDPLVDVTGAQALSAAIGAVQGQFPQFVFSAVGDADAHHDVVRFRWGLGPAGADPLVVGADVALLTGGDRIASVVGFLDKVPA